MWLGRRSETGTGEIGQDRTALGWSLPQDKKWKHDIERVETRRAQREIGRG